MNRSAVCVPVVYIESEPYLLLIRRSRKLQRHPGQIAFPGGFAEKDESLEQTALRELEEEIGVEEKRCKLLGKLDDTTTASSRIQITPFLVLLNSRNFRLNHEEVEEIYFVKLEIFDSLDCEEVIMPNGTPTIRYRLPGLVIWGATARIIKNSLKQIKEKLKEVCEWDTS